MIELSERERQIVTLLKEGKSQEEVAKEVFISVRVVKYLIQNMCDRYRIANKSIRLVSFAIENNLLEINAQKDNSAA